MKNLYAKGKGRIHPSPSSAAMSAAGSPRGEALAVLRILPAAILALTAALGSEDKEVLAYLIMRSISMPEEVAQQRRCGRPGELHTSLFACGCFDCYTSFWSRWDCSPDRELIHQAIEAFEDHLANSERAAGGGAKGRRRDRRPADLPERGKKKGKDNERVKEKENGKSADEISVQTAIDEEGNQKLLEGGRVEARFDGDEREKVDREELLEAAVNESDAAAPAPAGFSGGQPSSGGAERRKGWADVTAIFNSRLWSLWSPGD